MDKECLICYSPMSNETSFIFEECGHSYCSDCVEEWMSRKHKRCPLDSIVIESLNVPNRTNTAIATNTYKAVLEFLDFEVIHTRLQQKLSFPHFHAVDQETTDEEFKEMVADFFTNSKFLIYRSHSNDPILSMIIQCNLFYESIYQILTYELQSICLKIEFITKINADIIDNSKGCFNQYREQLIDRAQFIEYLRIVSDMLNKHYQQYCYHVNLYKLIFTKLLEQLNRFISDKMKAFFPNFSTDCRKINLSLSDISDVPTINRIKALENAISKTNIEDIEQYIFDDLLNENICLIEGLKEFLWKVVKISERERDSLLKEKLFKNDLYILWEKSASLCMLFNKCFLNPKVPSKYAWIKDTFKMTKITYSLIGAFARRFSFSVFSATITEGMEEYIKNLRELQICCRKIKRCVKIEKIEKLLETLLETVWSKT